jgi:hypothetical protein
MFPSVTLSCVLRLIAQAMRLIIIDELRFFKTAATNLCAGERYGYQTAQPAPNNDFSLLS